MENNSKNRIRDDFDKIAVLERDNWTSNHLYYSKILRKIPTTSNVGLEIGCGTGTLTRLLAEKSNRIIALDLSIEMINFAKTRSSRYHNIEYVICDAMEYQFPENYFDYAVSVATLHHMPLEKIIPKLKHTLKPNGILVIIDFFRLNGGIDHIIRFIAPVANVLFKLIKTRHIRKNNELSKAWNNHIQHDEYDTFNELKTIYRPLLPNAKIEKYLLWRYLLVWKK